MTQIAIRPEPYVTEGSSPPARRSAQGDGAADDFRPGFTGLRCRACGKQSSGWGLTGQTPQRAASQAVAPIRMPRRDARVVAQRRAA